jgi:hypothetical protein
MNMPEDYREAAEEAVAQAETLAGQGSMSDREFLESMARADRLNDHDVDECGMCCHQFIRAQAARDLLAEGDILDGIAKWVAETERRWQESKYFKLWQAEVAAGRDPHKAFEERGWQP